MEDENIQRIASIYDNWEAWKIKPVQPISFKEPYVPNLSAKYVGEFLSRHPELQKEKILDAGCGNGSTVLALQQLGYKVIGIDISSFAEHSISDFCRTSVTNLPFQDEEFGLVYSLSVLYYLEDLDRGLEELNRILQKRGYLIATFHTKHSFFTLERVIKRRLFHQKYGHINCLKFYSHADIVNAFHNNGFCIEKADGIHSFYFLTQLIYAYQFFLNRFFPDATNIFFKCEQMLERLFTPGFRAKYAYHGLYVGRTIK
jgi:SAM-dependent methyltransferase